MTWPDDRREYEQAIGVNELDGLIRDREPTGTRFLVFFWTKQGNVVGRPMYVTAESVTMAMRQVTIPAGTYEAVVHPVAPGKRVPVWHDSPKWAPSTDWVDIN